VEGIGGVVGVGEERGLTIGRPPTRPERETHVQLQRGEVRWRLGRPSRLQAGAGKWRLGRPSVTPSTLAHKEMGGYTHARARTCSPWMSIQLTGGSTPGGKHDLFSTLSHAHTHKSRTLARKHASTYLVALAVDAAARRRQRASGRARCVVRDVPVGNRGDHRHKQRR